MGIGESRYVGVEVGRESLLVGCLPAEASCRFTHDVQGIDALAALLCENEVERIVIEAVAGNETILACTLTTLGLPLAIVESKRVRDFAKARRIPAGTDKAGVLALLAQKSAPPTLVLPSGTQRALSGLLGRRTQLIVMRMQERARMCAAEAEARQDIEQHIVWLSKRIIKFDDDLGKCFRAAARPVDNGCSSIPPCSRGGGDHADASGPAEARAQEYLLAS